MLSQLDSLQRVFDSLVRPTEDRLTSCPAASGPRGTDPVWQIGHAAFDAAQALVRPHTPEHPLLLRFGQSFHGQRVQDPWEERRPTYPEVREWWAEILLEARRWTASLAPDAGLPAPVVFTAYTVRTAEEACDYVLFHTSFHLGRAYELLRNLTATPAQAVSLGS